MNPAQVHIDDDDRYSRLKLIAWWDQQRLARSRILVVGAGALGNEVLKNLALVGVGHITVVDFDRIENSNLSRSVLFRASDRGKLKVDVARRAVQEINPDVAVDALNGNVLTDIGLDLVRQMDVVIGCLDNRDARLWVNRMCWKVGTPWIDGGIQEINGVCKVFRPPDGACYECGMTDMDYQLIQLRYSCPLLKREDLQQGKVPTAPTIASIIGGLQVQEALKLLHEIPTCDGAALVFNGASNSFYQTKYQHRPECLSHEVYDPVSESNGTHDQTLKELAGELTQQLNLKIQSLELDRDFVTQLECRQCQITRSVMQPLPLLDFDQAVCEDCQEPMVPKMIHSIDVDSPLAVSHRLSQLGVPDRDILQLRAEDDVYFISLRSNQT